MEKNTEMELFISKLISSVVQIILFSLIPFLWWLVTARKKEKLFMLYSMKGVEMATSDFAGLEVNALPAILVYAIFNTALPEEIVFRGFLLKRISNKFGFTLGNITQGVLFGLLHGVMFFSSVGAVKAVIIIAFTGIIGVFMGYANEKKAGGSIIPGWCIHAMANIFSGACAAFSLF